MSKEVNFNFRTEADLRDRFNAAARFERRPASQVLRDLMHSYVDSVECRHGPLEKRSAWDELQRRNDLANAQASIELEGYVIPDEMKTMAEQFMRDEVSIDDVGKKADELAGR